MMFKHNKLTKVVLLGTTLALSFELKASALSFNLSYDTTSFGSLNIAALESATQYVANQYSSLFSNNVTLNIEVVGSNSPTTLGQSSTSYYSGYSYQQIKNALTSHESSPASISAIGSLPTIDPTNKAKFLVSTAEAKAIGLLPSSANPKALDGIFTIGDAQSYSFNPNNRAVSGEYDYIGIVEHEFSEIMGRIPGVSTALDTPMDLFRFTAPGVRNFSHTATGVYFSTNNGATIANTYNSVSGADTQDWAGNTLDAFNAFASPGQAQLLSATDIALMNTLGWQSIKGQSSLISIASLGSGTSLNSDSLAVPEPLTILGTLIGGTAAFRMRKRQKIDNKNII